MDIPGNNESLVINCTDCISFKKRTINIHNGSVVNVTQPKNVLDNLFIGPGLIDLQVNGVNGIDFNTTSLTPEDIINATTYLLSKGVTSYFPTIITNSEENIIKIAATINKACKENDLLEQCILGIHLEGPFISPVDGAKGAHDANFIKPPSWDIFQKFQVASGGRIKIITLSPEWEGSPAFIKKCTENEVLVSIGHSMATTEQVHEAVTAGACMSTHLGNGVPLKLPRHPNILWDQLSEEYLYTCLICDGIHIPNSFIKVAMGLKGDKALMVSDATCFAGMPAGEYDVHIGNSVIVDEENRVTVKGSPGILAGAAKLLDACIQYMVNKGISTLGHAWKMASVNIAGMLKKYYPEFDNNRDFVIFSFKDKKIVVQQVIKNGRLVFNASDIKNVKR